MCFSRTLFTRLELTSSRRLSSLSNCSTNISRKRETGARCSAWDFVEISSKSRDWENVHTKAAARAKVQYQRAPRARSPHLLALTRSSKKRSNWTSSHVAYHVNVSKSRESLAVQLTVKLFYRVMDQNLWRFIPDVKKLDSIFRTGENNT